MKRSSALLLFLLFYMIAFTAGFLGTFYLKNIINIYLNLFIGTLIATIIIYISSIIFKNASIYDPYWSVQPIYLLLTFYFVYNEYSFEPMHLLILIPLLFWAIRLTINWINGFTGLDFEDWRYRMIKEKIKNKLLKEITIFLGIMLMPTIVVYLGVLPLFTTFMVSSEQRLLFYLLGGLIVVIGTILEIVADYQMQQFRKAKTGQNIDSGLWKYSRHPNYLGELMVWTGIFVAALDFFAVINIFGVLSIYILFLFISIPMAEKRYLAKYAAYGEYQKKTSMLFLWKKRKAIK